jgi:hypothetical protein
MKPLSSAKTMVLPLRRAFLYAGHVLFSPCDNGLFVAFPRTTFGLLARPAHASQQVPDTRGIVGHSEVFADHRNDPCQGPQFGGKAVVRRSSQKYALQAFDLGPAQLGLGAGVSFGLQRIGTVAAEGRYPL